MTWRGPRTKGSTSDRGYGTAHAKARAAAAARHNPADPCVRCGKRLGPMGPWLHYDHNAARTGYLGFSHASCNVKAGAKVGRSRQTKSKIGATRLRW